MKTQKEYLSFQGFYRKYLTEHSHPVNRSLHFVGTFIVLVLVILSVMFANWKILILLPVSGYVFALVGHVFFEKNNPRIFKNPIWNIQSDFLMFWDILTFQLPAKLKEAQRKSEEALPA